MEISGIGGYRDGPVARSSFTSASTSLTDGAVPTPLLDKPPAVRSDGGGDLGGRNQGGRGRGRRHTGGHRASEPILLDFDLPSTDPTQTSSSQQPEPEPHAGAQQKQQKQQKQSADGSSSSSSGSKRKTGVPRLDNIIPPVTLSAERRAAYKQTLEERIERALGKSQAAWDGTSGIFDDSPKDWKLHVSKPNLTLYRRRTGAGSDESISTSRRFVSTGRIPGVTLQDIEYGLYAETTPDECALSAYWFGDYFLDAGILEVSETRTDDDPFRFFGVKWLLTGPFNQVKLVAPRDSAYIQYQKTVIDEYGEKVLVKIVESVPEDVVPHIPDQGDIHFVRIDFAIIYLYRYDPKAKDVQVFCEGRLDPAGRSTGWIANVNLTMFAPVIVQLENIADAKYITKHGLMFPHENSPTGQSTSTPSVSTYLPSPMASSTGGDTVTRLSHLTPNWVPDKKRKACFVCLKGFSLLRRHRHHCRMCGEVMCAECMVTLPLITPSKFDADKDANFPLQNQPESKKLEDSHRHGFAVVNLFKFCKKCMFAIRQERRAMVAGVGNYYFTEGMMHHYAQMQEALAGNNDEEMDESGYLDSVEDESVVDDVQYSKRIETLRQEHMEREKQKLRDQQKIQQPARVSVKLFDESDVSLPPSESASSSKQSETSSDFDSLEQKRKASGTSGSGFVSARTSNQSDAAVSSDHFEKMERSIAEQEALLNSIQEERAKAKAKAQSGGDAAQSRLPIGAAMQSMALNNPSVLTPTASVANQIRESELD